jgi:hypothetical protein
MGEVVHVQSVGTSVCSFGEQSTLEDGLLQVTSMTRYVSWTGQDRLEYGGSLGHCYACYPTTDKPTKRSTGLQGE